MLYKATISFSGVVSMTIGEVGEISDLAIVKDLMNAGYIVPVEDGDETKPKKETKKKTSKE